MKKTVIYIASLIALIFAVGCSHEPQPAQGDNANAANGTTVSQEQQQQRRAGGPTQTTNAPGTGRGASGNEAPIK